MPQPPTSDHDAHRTIVFDLDGTLVDSVPDLAAALNRVLAARNLAPFEDAAVASFVGDGAAALVARAFAARGTAQDARALAEFLADYGAHATQATRAYPGVAEALERLAAEGWRMAVCTNKPAAPTHALLAALGLARFFAAVGGGDSFPVRKPDPEHLRATLAAARGSASRAVMVGDHRNDILAASGIGIPCLFAAWGYSPRGVGAEAAGIAETAADIPHLAAALCPAP